ncbi:MAG: FAD-binding oxidoreductase [Planctomycetaceae bacterium]|nr:FAD-binding oxidoreductase [Planctomycetaceae bacterium]
MDPEQKRIEEDLRGIVAGDVLCADADRRLYATDASLFEVRPLVVVRPRSAEDVAATVAWAAQRGVPVHPRGGGSSVCGGSLGPGVVIDCSRSMRRILATDDETVRVQPGVVAASLEAHLAGLGRTFGPDPANAMATTIGGMIGRNSSGSRFPRHGAVRGRILTAEVVLGDGTMINLEPTAPQAAGAPHTGRAAALAAGVAEIVGRGRATIARFQPATRPSHAGYRCDDLVRPDGMVDLPRILCGAEGTLGIVTEATFCTVPADAATAVGLVLFDSLEKAAEAAVRLAARRVRR